MTKAKLLLMLLFSFLWIGDTAFTIAFVNALGLTAEANPMMRHVIANFGYVGFACIKASVLAFWLYIGRFAHWSIHLILTLIMVPVVYMGLSMALM